MADGGWKGVHPWVLGCSRQLSPNKFFDPSTPSMRKGRDRGNGGEKKTGGKKGKQAELGVPHSVIQVDLD